MIDPLAQAVLAAAVQSVIFRAAMSGKTATVLPAPEVEVKRETWRRWRGQEGQLIAVDEMTHLLGGAA